MVSLCGSDRRGSPWYSLLELARRLGSGAVEGGEI
jgi:hypothetical protein